MGKANAIGSGSVILTANADGLTSGLDRAARDVGRWGGRVQKAASGGGMIGLGKKVGMTLGKGVVLGAGIQFGKSLIGGGGGEGGGFGLGNVGGRLQELGRAGETARVFGITAEAYTGMAGAAKAAGSNQREFIESLATIGKLGSDAANGTAGAADAFAKLGLNAQEFNKLPTDEKYYTIMDAISKVSNETDRMYLAGKALGEDGMKNLLPLIGKTGDELRAMGAGFQRSSADIASAQRATVAMRGAQAALGKAFDTVVIALAPAFEYVSVLIPMAVDALGSNFTGMGDIVTPVLRGLSVGAGYLWDTIKAGAGIVTNIAGTIVETLGMVVDVFSESIKSILSTADGLFRELKSFVGGMPDAVKLLNPWFMAVDAMPEDTFARMADQVDGVAESLQSTGKGMADLGKGMVDEFGQSAAAAGAFFDEFERKRAEALAKKAVKPGAVAQVSPKLLDPPKLAGALEKGSAEAYRAVVRHQLPGITGAADDAKKQTRVLEQVEKRVRELIDVVRDTLSFEVV